MYWASAIRHVLSCSSGTAVYACTTAATRSAGAATGTQLSCAAATCSGRRPDGSPSNGFRQRWHRQPDVATEVPHGGDRRHDRAQLHERQLADVGGHGVVHVAGDRAGVTRQAVREVVRRSRRDQRRREAARSRSRAPTEGADQDRRAPASPCDASSTRWAPVHQLPGRAMCSHASRWASARSSRTVGSVPVTIAGSYTIPRRLYRRATACVAVERREGGSMYKVIWLTKFRSDMPREEVLAWWRGPHADLAKATPGMIRYVQSYWTSALDDDTQLATGVLGQFDGHAEHWFADRESYERGDGERRVEALPRWTAQPASTPHPRRRRGRGDRDHWTPSPVACGRLSGMTVRARTAGRRRALASILDGGDVDVRDVAVRDAPRELPAVVGAPQLVVVRAEHREHRCVGLAARDERPIAGRGGGVAVDVDHRVEHEVVGPLVIRSEDLQRLAPACPRSAPGPTHLPRLPIHTASSVNSEA